MPPTPGTVRRLTEIESEEVSLVDRAANKRRFLVFKRAGTEQQVELMPDALQLTLSKDVKKAALDALAKPLDALTALITKVEGSSEVDEPGVLPEAVVTDALGVSQAIVAAVADGREADEVQKAIERAKDAGVAAKIMRRVVETTKGLAQYFKGDGKLDARALTTLKSIGHGLTAMVARCTIKAEEDELPASVIELPEDPSKAVGVAVHVLQDVVDTGTAVAAALEAAEPGSVMKAGHARAVLRVSKTVQGLVEKFPADVIAAVQAAETAGPLANVTKASSPADVAMALCKVIEDLPGVPPEVLSRVHELSMAVDPYVMKQEQPVAPAVPETPPPALSTAPAPAVPVTAPSVPPEVTEALVELRKARTTIDSLSGEVARLRKAVEPPASRPAEQPAGSASPVVPLHPQNYNDPEYKAAVAKAGGPKY